MTRFEVGFEKLSSYPTKDCNKFSKKFVFVVVIKPSLRTLNYLAKHT